MLNNRYHPNQSSPKTTMNNSQRVTHLVNNIKDTRLSKKELYQLHYHISNMVGRRMFYQLIFRAGWAPGVPQHRDHTDWYHEVMDDLASLIVESMNYEQVRVEELPKDMFDIKGLNVVGIKDRYRTDNDLFKIMTTYLPSNGYGYEIIQHEVSFD